LCGKCTPEGVRRDEVRVRRPVLDLDHRQQLSIAALELWVARDVDLDELEGQLAAHDQQDLPSPVAEVAAGRVVERDQPLAHARFNTGRAGYRAAMARRVLVVTTVPADDPALREELGDAEVRVVAPAAKISKLDFLTNAEDDARAAATEAADRTAETLAETADVKVDRTSHDTEAAQAIDDALRNFAAEEIVVVTSADSTWLEDETVQASLDATGLPVKRLELPGP